MDENKKDTLKQMKSLFSNGQEEVRADSVQNEDPNAFRRLIDKTAHISIDFSKVSPREERFVVMESLVDAQKHVDLNLRTQQGSDTFLKTILGK